MSEQCYLVEPIFSKVDTLDVSCREDWLANETRAILGWVNSATGEQNKYPHMFGVGAMWYALWQPKNWDWDNEEGPHLIVKTPGGDWDIDSRCANCTLPEDKLHRCWVRHGEPPNISVDKNGLTCSAGGGSIISGSYHGFLTNGIFRSC